MSKLPGIPQSNIARMLLLVFFLIILASRLPLLGGGFGSDDDSWRNAASALHMREAGRYIASRIPGFPVFEGLLVLLVPLGWTATNLLTAAAGVIASLIFLNLCGILRVRSSFWLTFAFAFSGVMWVHSTQTMDYAVGLAFLLGAYRALLDRRFLIGGLLLALAAGCRLTMGTLALPALMMLVYRKENRRSIAAFAGSFIAFTIIVFIPVIVMLEPQSFIGEGLRHSSQTHVTFATLPGFIRAGIVFLFGKLGAVILILGIIWKSFGKIRRRISSADDRQTTEGDPEFGRLQRAGEVARRSSVIFEAGAVVIVGILYLLIPYESAYLIPLFPFALLLAGRLLSRRMLVVIALLMASEVAVMPLIGQCRLVPGRLFQEIERRRADLETSRSLASIRISEPTIFVIGRFSVHRLLVLAPSLERTDAAYAPFKESGVALWSADKMGGYAAYLNKSERAELMNRGYRIVDVEGY